MFKQQRIFVVIFLLSLNFASFVSASESNKAGQISGSSTAANCSLTRGPYLQLSRQSSIYVRWRTNVACNSRVRFGFSPSNLNFVFTNTTPVTEHVVIATGLQGWRPYYYSIGTTTATLAGPIPMYTSPVDHHPGVTMRFWALGNAGTGNANAAAVRNAYQNFNGSRVTNLILLLGDNAYPAGSDADFQRGLFNVFGGFFRRTSVLPTIGHIDTNNSVNPSTTIPYFRNFTLPTGPGGGGYPSRTEKYFSYNFGIVHFVCLDTQASGVSPTGAMLSWLEQDLERNTLPWLVVYFHHPPYSKGSRNSDVEQRMIQVRQNIIPMLEYYGVDLVLSAHSNSYERSVFLNGHYGMSNTLTSAMKIKSGDGRPASEGGSGVYNKAAGARHAGAVYAVVGSSGTLAPGPLNHPAMYRSLMKLGSLVFDVFNNRLDAKFVQADGKIGDAFTIIKNNLKPSLQLTSPQNGASYNAGSNIVFSANASDPDTHIQRLKFLANDVTLFADYKAPFTFTWTNVRAGKYTIRAEVRDDLGATTHWGPITINVN